MRFDVMRSMLDDGFSVPLLGEGSAFDQHLHCLMLCLALAWG
jgi:hypothetical protein